MLLRGAVQAAKRNFFDVVSKLPRAGEGQSLNRTKWGPDSYWTVKRVQLSLDGSHGKAYGVLTWRGKTEGKITCIRGTLKKVWRPLDTTTGIQWKSVKKPALDGSSRSDTQSKEPPET